MGDRKTGTREWAEANLNIALGCEHGCRYCYARANALRFKRIDGPEDLQDLVAEGVVESSVPVRRMANATMVRLARL